MSSLPGIVASTVTAPSAIHAFQPAKKGRPSRLVVNFMGMLGPNGPLPIHLTEYAYERIRNEHDHTWARFLEPEPPPGYHDLFALRRYRRIQIEGDIRLMSAYLFYIKRLFALLREVGAKS